MSRIERVVTYTSRGPASGPIEGVFADLRAVAAADHLDIDESTWDFDQEFVEDGTIVDAEVILTGTFRTVTVSTTPKVLAL